jgi:hypothetical protein
LYSIWIDFKKLPRQQHFIVLHQFKSHKIRRKKNLMLILVRFKPLACEIKE